CDYEKENGEERMLNLNLNVKDTISQKHGELSGTNNLYGSVCVCVFVGVGGCFFCLFVQCSVFMCLFACCVWLCVYVFVCLCMALCVCVCLIVCVWIRGGLSIRAIGATHCLGGKEKKKPPDV